MYKKERLHFETINQFLEYASPVAICAATMFSASYSSTNSTIIRLPFPLSDSIYLRRKTNYAVHETKH